MSFTTAGTVTTAIVGRSQFQRLFSEVFAITITGANPSSIAAGAEDFQLYTVPGIRKGDMVLGYSFDATLGSVSDVQMNINTNDTLIIRISNLDPSAALDIVSGDIHVLVGRPTF